MKRLFVLIALALMLVAGLAGFGVSSAHAQVNSPDRPLITCGSCSGNFGWTGNVRGAKTTMTISNPGLNCANGDTWQRYISLPGSGVGMESGKVGIITCGSTAGLYGCASDSLSVFEVLSGVTPASWCTTVGSSDINHNLNIVIDDNVNAGSVFVNAQGSVSGTNYNGLDNGVTIFKTNTFGEIDLAEIFNTTTSWTGHKVWGSEFINNQYDSTSGNGFHYQSGSGSFGVVDNPTQMYWNSTPNGGTNNGGIMYLCEYSSGTTCTLGS